jgi:hypothetical protein
LADQHNSAEIIPPICKWLVQLGPQKHPCCMWRPHIPVAAIRCLAFFSTSSSVLINCGHHLASWHNCSMTFPSASQRAEGQPNLGTGVTDPQAAASVKSEVSGGNTEIHVQYLTQTQLRKIQLNPQPKIHGSTKVTKSYRLHQKSSARSSFVMSMPNTSDSWS